MQKDIKDYKDLTDINDPVDIIEYWTKKNKGARVDIFYNKDNKTVEEEGITHEEEFSSMDLAAVEGDNVGLWFGEL